MTVVLQSRPTSPVLWPRHRHGCGTCQVLAELLSEWTRADPAGVAWWHWRTGRR